MDNNKIDWRRKLSSRKFWVALVGFVSATLFAFNVAEADIEKVTGVIMAGSSLISYVLAEGYIDGKREEKDFYTENNYYNNDKLDC